MQGSAYMCMYIFESFHSLVLMENWDSWPFGEFVCNFKVGKTLLKIDRIARRPSIRAHTFTNYTIYTVAYKYMVKIGYC